MNRLVTKGSDKNVHDEGKSMKNEVAGHGSDRSGQNELDQGTSSAIKSDASF